MLGGARWEFASGRERLELAMHVAMVADRATHTPRAQHSAPPCTPCTADVAASLPTAANCFTAQVVAQLVCSIGSFALPAFRREVQGGMSALLADHGITFDADITFLQLSVLAARGGGLNYLMAAVFFLFNVLTPVLRGLSLLALLLVPMSREAARRLYLQSKVAVAYYSLDVMIVATPLINYTFGPRSPSRHAHTHARTRAHTHSARSRSPNTLTLAPIPTLTRTPIPTLTQARCPSISSSTRPSRRATESTKSMARAATASSSTWPSASATGSTSPPSC